MTKKQFQNKKTFLRGSSSAKFAIIFILTRAKINPRELSKLFFRDEINFF